MIYYFAAHSPNSTTSRPGFNSLCCAPSEQNLLTNLTTIKSLNQSPMMQANMDPARYELPEIALSSNEKLTEEVIDKPSNRLITIENSFIDLAEVRQQRKLYDDICNKFKIQHLENNHSLVLNKVDAEDCLPQLIICRYSELYPDKFHNLVVSFANSESNEFFENALKKKAARPTNKLKMTDDSFIETAGKRKRKIYDEIRNNFKINHPEEYSKLVLGELDAEDCLSQLIGKYSKLSPEELHSFIDTYENSESEKVLKGDLNTNTEGSINSKTRLKMIGDTFVDLAEDRKRKICDESYSNFKMKHSEEYQKLSLIEHDVEDCVSQRIQGQTCIPKKFTKLLTAMRTASLMKFQRAHLMQQKKVPSSQ